MKIAFVFLLCLLSLNCYATCIIIAITKDGIYVAADGRRNLHQYNSQGILTTLPQTVCKIHNVGKDYFVVAGVDDSQLAREITHELDTKRSWDDITNSFQLQMKLHYNKLFIDDRKDFKKILLESKGKLAEVAFFCYFGNQPSVRKITISGKLNSIGQLIISSKLVEPKGQIILIGIYGNLLFKTPPSYFAHVNQNDIPALIEAMVNYEAKFHPNDIAGPVDVLLLTQNGSHWIKKNNNIVSY
ncbi:hypothetical protein [Mucilaginibacter sp. NFX135]|uniref:hypothetical protein n=1 Tax=Mucilaginibacter sp. NFX135 TaxID=3402687 RepID=UPI003AFA80BF